jgi:hypothetical protein
MFHHYPDLALPNDARDKTSKTAKLNHTGFLAINTNKHVGASPFPSTLP